MQKPEIEVGSTVDAPYLSHDRNPRRGTVVARTDRYAWVALSGNPGRPETWAINLCELVPDRIEVGDWVRPRSLPDAEPYQVLAAHGENDLWCLVPNVNRDGSAGARTYARNMMVKVK